MQVPQFSLYVKKEELVVTLIKVPPPLVSLTAEELALYQTFHSTLFTQVLATAGPRLQPLFPTASSNFLVVPLQSMATFNSPIHFLDSDMAQHFAAMAEEKPLVDSWPHVLVEKFVGALVSKKYHTELTKHGQKQLYEVQSINRSESPTSPFPEAKVAATYAQYFKQKYNFTFTDISQPSLTCRPVGMGAKSLILTVSNYEASDGRQRDGIPQRSETIKLFPEQCQIYPLSASYWKLCRCVPSILKRLQSLLLVDELSSEVSSLTGIGVVPAGFEITTKTCLRGTQDPSAGRLSTRAYWVDGAEEMEAAVSHLEEIAAECNVPRKPDNGLLLQAITAASANDSINLERLESLGDSFLKLVTSVDLFCSRQGSHEGRLSTARMRRISNFNLYYLAVQKGITRMILSRPFDPLNTWVPPSFCYSESPTNLPLVASPNELPEETRNFLYQKVADKGVADCVEALIGAYVVAGGIEAGLKFLQWLGLKLETPCKSPKRPKIVGDEMPSMPLFFNPLLLQNSSAVFTAYCSPPPPSVLQGGDNVDQGIMKMTSTCHILMEKLQWTFQDRALLLQALTHPSYIKNRITDSYQRLEFLGDAILDYLITCHVYYRFPKFTPGQITDMRSALVNNFTFAKIAVTKLGIHQFLKHDSPALFRQISEFVDAIQRHSKAEGRDIFGLPEPQNSTVNGISRNVDDFYISLCHPRNLCCWRVCPCKWI